MKTASWLMAILLALGGAAARADDLHAAKEHFRKARVLFELGRYQEAVPEFEASFLAKDDPATLYNLAQAQRLAGMNAAALRSYRAYLVRVPDASNRSDVEAVIKQLRSAPARVEPAPPPPPTAQPEATAPKPEATAPKPIEVVRTEPVATQTDQARPLYKKWWLWTIVGGVVVLGVGLGVGLGLGLQDSFNPSLGEVKPALSVRF
jgi:tetratricopeptide (TPR) repeat protein